MTIKGLDQFLAWPKKQVPKQQRKPSVWTWVVRGVGLGVVGGAAFVVFVLPDMMSCGSKVILSEAKTTVGSMNRAQQAYESEQNKFAIDIPALQLGIKPQTQNYDYSTLATPTTAFNFAIARRGYTLRSHSFGPFAWHTRGDDLKGYVGAVFLVPMKDVQPGTQSTQKTTIAILCEATTPGAIRPAEPIYKQGVMNCGAGTEQIR